MPESAGLSHLAATELRQRLEHNISLYEQGAITFAELDASVQGWINHVRYGDTWGLRSRLFREQPLRQPAMREGET